MQGFGFLNECTLLVGILLIRVFQCTEELSLLSKEAVAGSPETFKDLDVHGLWRKTNAAPLLLKLKNLLRVTIPIGTAFTLLGSDGFHLLAELSFASQVFFLLGTQSVVVLLMTLVDNR